MKNTVSLNKNELFLRVYKKGQRSYNKFFSLHYIQNGLTYNRLGIKTGKKLCGAVRRNRLKRLIKESYRLCEDRIKTGFDIVIAAKEESLNIDSYFLVSREIEYLLKRAKLLKP